MRSLTVSCLVWEESPKILRYQGIPTLPSSSATMIVAGVSSVLSGTAAGLGSPASSVAPDWGPSADCASFDEAWVPWAAPAATLGAWVSSSAKAAGVLTAVATRAQVTTSASAMMERWDISGSLD